MKQWRYETHTETQWHPIVAPSNSAVETRKPASESDTTGTAKGTDAAAAAAATATAAGSNGTTEATPQPKGGLWRVCVPSSWLGSFALCSVTLSIVARGGGGKCRECIASSCACCGRPTWLRLGCLRMQSETAPLAAGDLGPRRPPTQGRAAHGFDPSKSSSRTLRLSGVGRAERHGKKGRLLRLFASLSSGD